MWIDQLLLWGSMILLVLLGCPIAYAIGIVSVGAAWLVWGGMSGLFLIASSAAEVTANNLLLAIPLFVFMAKILEISGITEDLFETMYIWFGRLHGGLAIGTTIIGVILGAMMGAAPASTAVMASMAIGPMQKRGYDMKLVLGCIAASGALAIIIPPSILMLVYCSLTGVSPGKMFISGIIPGLLMGLLFCLYIGIKCHLNPSSGPAASERYSWSQKIKSLKAVLLPFIIIILVLGSIYMGFATATEAAAVGAFGCLVIVILRKKLRYQFLKDSLIDTMKITAYIMWIVLSATCFMRVVSAMATSELILQLIKGLSLNPYVILAFMQIIFIVLGCVLDPLGIMLITVPIFVPIANMLGFDPLSFGLILVVNLSTSFITPPFGLNLFIVKGLAPEGYGIGDIVRGATPFFMMEMVTLILLIVFPTLVTFLPSLT